MVVAPKEVVERRDLVDSCWRTRLARCPIDDDAPAVSNLSGLHPRGIRECARGFEIR